MKCENAEELLSALLDDELTPSERMGVEAHIRTCPRCAGAQRWLADARDAVRTLAQHQHELPPGFWPALLKRLDAPDPVPQTIRPAPSAPWLGRIPIRAAASIGLAAVVVGIALSISWFAPMPSDRGGAELPVGLLALDFEQQVAAAPSPWTPGAFPGWEGAANEPVTYAQPPRPSPDPHVTFVSRSRRCVSGVVATQSTYDAGLRPVALYQLPARQVRLSAGRGAATYEGRFVVVPAERCCVVAWADGDTAYAVVSDMAPPALVGLAQRLATTAEAPGA